MQRVKFTEDTGRYSKGECVALGDEDAAAAVKNGLAMKIPGPISVGDEMAPPQEMQRIAFTSNVTEGGRVIFSAGSRAFLPRHEAARYIENGKAEPFDIVGVGSMAEPKAAPINSENKMVKQAQRQKGGV